MTDASQQEAAVGAGAGADGISCCNSVSHFLMAVDVRILHLSDQMRRRYCSQTCVHYRDNLLATAFRQERRRSLKEQGNFAVIFDTLTLEAGK